MASSRTHSQLWPEGKHQSIEELVSALSDDDPFVRQRAGQDLLHVSQRLQRRGRLADLGLRMAINRADLLLRLVTEAQQANAQGRAAIAECLGRWRYVRASPVLLSLLSDGEPLVRASAALALGESGDTSACESLHFTLGDDSLWVRKATADALGSLGMDQSGTVLAMALDQEDQPLVRSSIVSALGHINTPAARNTLTGALEDPDPTLRWHAARSLAAMGNVGALPLLKSLATDEAMLYDQTIGEMATKAISAIEKRERGPFRTLLKTLYALKHRIAKLRRR